MVCDRCIYVVEESLKKLEISFEAVSLGQIELAGEISNKELEKLSLDLQSHGFEIIDDSKSELIEKIKQSILELFQADRYDLSKIKVSEYLSNHLHYDYKYLSNLFSRTSGQSIEQYFIRLKIEKAKELLVYKQLSLSEIAFQLGYSSVSHLSNQFKKITGLTASHFKDLGATKNRHSLDKV